MVALLLLAILLVLLHHTGLLPGFVRFLAVLFLMAFAVYQGLSTGWDTTLIAIAGGIGLMLAIAGAQWAWESDQKSRRNRRNASKADEQLRRIEERQRRL